MKILKEVGIPDHLTCLLRNLNAGQEATVRTGHGTTDWFRIGKGIHQGCILLPCLFNLYAKYKMKPKLELRFPGEILITSDIGETMETVTDYIFLGSKITADGDYSHEMRRLFLLGGKVMSNIDSILKSRDITLPAKVHLVKAPFFPVVMYGCESWAIKKAEC